MSKRLMEVTAVAVICALVAQVLLFMVSWLISAASPETTVRPLLSNEGIRWFFGSFADNVATPQLVWLLVTLIAYGTVSKSQIVETLLKGRHKRTYRQTFALRIVLAQFIVFILVLMAVALVPHAALLSVTGQLFPGPFARCVIPSLAFFLFVAAATYGLLAGVFRGLAEVMGAACEGLAKAAPLIVLFIVVSELFFSFLYVFRMSS